MTETKPDLHQMEAVYIGRRRTTKGTGVAFVLPDQLGGGTFLDGECSVFPAPKRLASFVVGGIYDVNAEVKDGRLVALNVNRVRFLRISDDARRMSWEARDANHAADVKAEALAAKLKKNGSAIEANVTALRDAYRRTPPSDRQAFEWLVLDMIRKPIAR